MPSTSYGKDYCGPDTPVSKLEGICSYSGTNIETLNLEPGLARTSAERWTRDSAAILWPTKCRRLGAVRHGRIAHQRGEVAAVKVRILIDHDIGEPGALGRFRAVLEAVIERLENLLGVLR